MNTPPSGARPPAPEVAPVEHGGVRYVQDAHDAARDDQAGGYLAALDANTGERLWRIKVYEVPGQGSANPQLSIYFRSMQLSGDTLEIEDEIGRVFRVGLATRKVTQASGPAMTTTQQQPTRPKPRPE